MRKLLLIDLHRPVQAVFLWAVRVGSEGCKFIFGIFRVCKQQCNLWTCAEVWKVGVAPKEPPSFTAKIGMEKDKPGVAQKNPIPNGLVRHNFLC